MTKQSRKSLLKILLPIGFVSILLFAAGSIFVLNYYDLSFRQALLKILDRSGLNNKSLENIVSASAMFPDFRFDGQMKQTHPRILLPQLANWNGFTVSHIIDSRSNSFEEQDIKISNPCKARYVQAQALCWIMTADPSVARNVIKQLESFIPKKPVVQGKYGNAWKMALAYDLISTYPEISEISRDKIENTLLVSLKEYVGLLNNDGPSLWHGRATLAAMSWIIAVALGNDTVEKSQWVTQAQAHFLEVIRAWELTEGWPEGYNYWIQNRAFLLVLASSAYLNSLEFSANESSIKKLLERSAYWHIYATRPDNRIEGYGDEGSRVDLKDETQRVIDLIAQATQNPIIAQYSRYLRRLHGNQGYYRDYRWGMFLFKDPDIFSSAQDNKDLSNFHVLPKSDWFGKGAFNQFFIRSGWGADDTFISYRAGASLVHHGHYDAGHFSIFKKSPLAVNSSTYGDFSGSNRLNYSIRTIAKNSLLVLKPGETVKPNRFFIENVSDGGQRLTMPTGSQINNVSQWLENLGKGRHYEGGNILHYDFQESEYVYIESDITSAYNSQIYDANGDNGKVELVKRSLFYDFPLDLLITFDQVRSAKKSYIKKWILHSVDQPLYSGGKVLQGDIDNGILETEAKVGLIKNKKSYLKLYSLFPSDAITRIIGGLDYQYYVESDGDESHLDGRNYAVGAAVKPWFDQAMWRIEIQAKSKEKNTDFLTLLSPSLNKPKSIKFKKLNINNVVKGVMLRNKIILFSLDGKPNNLILENLNGAHQLYLMGLPESTLVKVNLSGVESEKQVNSQGVVSVKLPRKDGPLKLVW